MYYEEDREEYEEPSKQPDKKEEKAPTDKGFSR